MVGVREKEDSYKREGLGWIGFQKMFLINILVGRLFLLNFERKERKEFRKEVLIIFWVR